MIAKACKNGFLDYKSAALPTELCRHFPRKILSDASSASDFLYAFSVRLRSTLVETSFRIRPQRTDANSHRFGIPATRHPLHGWSSGDVPSDNARRMRRQVWAHPTKKFGRQPLYRISSGIGRLARASRAFGSALDWCGRT